MSTIIDVSQLSKTFISKKRKGLFGPKVEKHFSAVKELTFTVKKGEFIAFLGPNGAGKTTTLKMLTGILYPSSGSALVAEHIPWKKENAFKKTISFVMAQKSQLFLELPIKDTFDFLSEIYQVEKSHYQKLLHDLLNRFELSDKLETPGRRLSLGQRMKAELICCFLYNPQIIFLDEPTIGLDVNSAIEVRNFLKESNKQLGTTVILTTHNMDDVEALCDRTLVINNGKMMFNGSTRELKGIFGDDRVIEFITDTPDRIRRIPEIKSISYDHTSVYITCERSHSARIIASVLEQADVHEINIKEKELSEVIAQIYKHEYAKP